MLRLIGQNAIDDNICLIVPRQCTEIVHQFHFNAGVVWRDAGSLLERRCSARMITAATAAVPFFNQCRQILRIELKQMIQDRFCILQPAAGGEFPRLLQLNARLIERGRLKLVLLSRGNRFRQAEMVDQAGVAFIGIPGLFSLQSTFFRGRCSSQIRGLGW